jgi:ArsR family transcriptional regulator
MKDYHKQARRFKALSDATRLQIVEMLTEGGLCACKILAHFNITQPTLSYHMKILCGSGIVSCRREGAWMWYSINPEVLAVMEFLLKKLQKTNAKNEEGCACGEGLR